MPIFFV